MRSNHLVEGSHGWGKVVDICGVTSRHVGKLEIRKKIL